MLNKKEQRLRRSRQTRARIAKQGVARLSVFRSNLHIYASIISEDGSRVVASASTAEKDSAPRCRTVATPLRRPWSASASPKRRRLLESRRSHSIALALPTTVVSRPWLRRLAKPACSSNV